MSRSERLLIRRLFKATQPQRDELIGMLRTQVAIEDVLLELKSDVGDLNAVLDNTTVGDSVIEQQIREVLPRPRRTRVLDEEY